MSEKELKDKVVIITGASGALGQELAYNLSRHGSIIILAAREVERLEKVANKCRELGAKAIIVQADVTKEDQCKALIDKAIKEYGRIDMLINNAAYSLKKKFVELPNLDAFKYTLEVNYYGSVYCSRYALPYLKASKGRIVGVCSVLGKVATPGNSAYCSSKYAMSAFFDVLRLELINDGVSVTMIYPGYLAEKMSGGKDVQPQSGLWNKISSILAMKSNICADKIIKAAISRKRQVVIPFYSVIIVWLNFILPGFLSALIRLMAKIRYSKEGKSTSRKGTAGKA